MTSEPVPTFPRERLARLREVEDRHFWFIGRRALVDQLIERHVPSPARILDIGCGTGAEARRLAGLGHRVVGVDVRPDWLSANGPDEATFVRGSAVCLPICDGAVDSVLALDVLEHLDDGAALREVVRVLRPGGALVATVPAGPALWSHRDRAAGHLRRYTRRTLQGALVRAGLDVREVRPYQFFAYPVMAAGRLLGPRSTRVRDREDAPGPIVNRLLTWVNLMEVRLGRTLPWPVGSTLAVAAVRR
jgi:SAM-dependent methyltransferase